MPLCEKSLVLGISTECKMVYEIARMLTESQYLKGKKKSAVRGVKNCLKTAAQNWIKTVFTE
jgi:hypothetical protein